MAPHPVRSQWRAWDGVGDDAGALHVTSQRLARGAPVQNRLFPKMRSWVALGAPLELMSPLSVARPLLVLGSLASLAVLGLGHPRPLWLALLVTVGFVSAFAVALRLGQLTARGCRLVAAATAAGTVLLVAAVHAGPAAAVVMWLLAPAALFAGLYLPGRYASGLQLVAATLLGATVAIWRGVAAGAALGVAVALGTVAVALGVTLVAGSARRRNIIDPDTGLPNGFGLAEHLVEQCRSGPVIVATVVLGGLGEAREALGYRVGTELVRRAVEDLGQVLPGDAWIARADGDELVVTQPVELARSVEPAEPVEPVEPVEPGDLAAAAQAQADALAVQLVAAIGSGRYVAGAVEVWLRAHVGLVVAPVDGDEVAELVRRSSLAARRARSAGHTHVRWDGADGAMTSSDLELLADLRMAAGRQELWMAYQPQISVRTDTTTAVEALMRWTSPRHGSVPPGVFIPLAERLGLIDRLTDWMLAEVLDAQVRWTADGLDLPVSVNISPLSLSDPGLSDRVLLALSTRGLAPRLLAVEVTETAAVDVIAAVDHLRPLHDRGVRVSIDDFGTGYTSLSILPHLPVDELKVDQRFVQAAEDSPAERAIVEAMVDLAHRLGLDAVAEGVETAESSRQMRAIGFDLLQGYHFARPLAEPDLVAFVAAEGSTDPDGHRPAGQRPDGRAAAS